MVSPWLTIVGIGEDGLDGLSAASRDAISRAAVVAGAPRHLALVGKTSARQLEWPVPFADGVEQVLALRGQLVVALASGNPFWFGAGAVLVQRLVPEEWVAYPSPSSFSLAVSRLGWRMEDVVCLGLHASPLTRLRPHLCANARLVLTLRDSGAVRDLMGLLTELGFGPSRLWIMEALGGPRAKIRCIHACDEPRSEIGTPVLAAIEVAGSGAALAHCAGLADDVFEHDGQITKRPVRAVTISALAPKTGELLWDIGAGSGSVAIEWLLAHPSMRAIAIEADAGRAARLARNAAALGVDRLVLQHGTAPDVLTGLPLPDAVFIGGGCNQSMLEALWRILPTGARLVANSVTLETEILLLHWHGKVGGSLLRIELAEAQPVGSKRGWRSAMPIIQWSVVR